MRMEKLAQTPAKNITVGYVNLKKQKFISTTVNNKNFLNGLSKFVRIVRISTNSMKYDLRKSQEFDIDYLVVDMNSFGASHFILREKDNVNISFVIVLRTIEPWFTPLLRATPLIKERDIIIAPSVCAKNSFLRISKQLKVHVIPNCLDVKNIQKRIPHHVKKRRKVITFMGRLAKEKGIQILIACIPEIISKVGDVHLNIIGPLSGDGINNYPKSLFVKKLEERIKRLGLANNVTFKGLKLGFNKYRILSESDVFILPTMAETFGISVLEALVCGVPVVTTNLECFKHLIKEGENGYLVGVRYDKNGHARIDRKKLINSCTKILQDRKLAFKMKQRAREQTLHYDFRKVMPRLVKLLERKKMMEVKDCNRWEMLKDKRVIDFKDLYEKEIKFFINFDKNAHRTYSSIYDRIKKSKLPGVQRTDDLNRRIKDTHKKLLKKIKSEFVRYLCGH